MILVRRRGGLAYFLAHDREEDGVLVELANRFPGAPVAIVERREGLLLVRVGSASRHDDDGGGNAVDRFAIVGLCLRRALGSHVRAPAF